MILFLFLYCKIPTSLLVKKEFLVYNSLHEIQGFTSSLDFFLSATPKESFMKAAGIIAEYNPFHRGHLHQIREIRQKLGSDTPIVAAMSGSFVQRGEPAIADLLTRAKGALACGVDLVVEIPFTFACAPAPRFAAGAVFLLQSLGILSHLSFGCETDQLALLQRIADLSLLREHDIDTHIRAFQKDGDAYPLARAKALSALMSEDPELSDVSPDLLRAPNTILAIEYLRAIQECESTLKPLLVHRIGAAYHELGDTGEIMSATGLRACFRDVYRRGYQDPSRSAPTCAAAATAPAATTPMQFAGDIAQALPRAMPPEAFAHLLEDWHRGICPVFPADLAFPAVHSLMTHEESYIREMAYMGDCLSAHLKNSVGELRVPYPESVRPVVNIAENTEALADAFSRKIYTKRYANTRVNRALMSLLVGQTARDIELLDQPKYIRVIGFSPKGRFLLKVMRERATLPMVTKASDFREFGGEDRLVRMAELDLTARELWNQCAGLPFGEEFRRVVVQTKRGKPLRY